MSFPPEVYLIGAQKSGTTTLAYLLSQHPDICLSEPKEPHFFSLNWHRGLAWYQNQFANDKAKVCIDASTTYSMAPLTPQRHLSKAKQYFPNIPQRIYSLNPQAKFIYIIRNPVERTYSAYWHYYSRGIEKDNFREAIANDSFHLDISNYYGQLQLWLDYFPIESFQFLLFEDMKKDPERIIQDCLQFVGVDSSNVQIDSQALNRAKHVNGVGRLFNKLFTYTDYYNLHLVPPSFKRFISIRGIIRRLTTSSNIVIPKMQAEDQLFLHKYFCEMNQNLELLTGLTLSQWQV